MIIFEILAPIPNRPWAEHRINGYDETVKNHLYQAFAHANHIFEPPFHP